MNQISFVMAAMPLVMSPLVLCDRLLRLAEDADHAGFPVAAEHLLRLADEVPVRPFVLRD